MERLSTYLSQGRLYFQTDFKTSTVAHVVKFNRLHHPSVIFPRKRSLLFTSGILGHFRGYHREVILVLLGSLNMAEFQNGSNAGGNPPSFCSLPGLGPPRVQLGCPACGILEVVWCPSVGPCRMSWVNWFTSRSVQVSSSAIPPL